MAITRVNGSAITGSGTTATAYTATLPAVLAGDLIVVTANCNGTHVTNGMSCSETSTSTALTTIHETDQGGSSSRWLQTFYLYVTNDIASGTIRLTPYASNTASSMSIDIFRGTSGVISRAVQGNSAALGTTASTPALATAPPAGDLVLSLVSVSSGTATKPTAYTAGSTIATNVRTANAYVLSADGTSTYGGTWTWGSSNTSALQTVSFSANTAPVVATVASANNNTAGYPVSVPTGTVDNDLLIGVVASDFGTFAGNVLGTGWTALTTSTYDGGTNAFHIGLWARVASSEPASYTVSLDSSDSVSAILRITGWDLSSGIAGAVKQVAPSTTGTGTTAPSIVPAAANDLLLTFHAAENSAGGARTWTPPAGMTEWVDRQSSTWTTLEVCALENPANPSGTQTATPSAAVDTGAACTLSIKAPGTGGGFTGSAAVTEAADTSSATGQLGYSGAVAATEAPDTSSATGTVVNPVTGTAAAAQANQVAAGSGQLGYSGSAASTQAAQTSTATGNLGYAGSSTATQAAQTSAATGQLGYSGSSTATQASQSATAAGQLGYTASATAAQAPNTSTATGTFTASGTAGSAAVTQAPNTSTATGQLGYTGTSGRTQAGQTSTATGQLGYSATAATSQAAQAAAASGSFTSAGSFTGAAAAGQASQTGSATGQLGYAATATAGQASQTAAATGAVVNPVTGTASPTQANQTASSSGKLGYAGAASAAQAGNTANAAGIVSGPTSGTASATQASQTASIAGYFTPLITFGTASAGSMPTAASSSATATPPTASGGTSSAALASATTFTVPTATGG